MRSSWMLVLAVAVGCGTAPRAAPHVRMSPRDIIDASSPAIVRITAGEGKVGTGFVIDADGLIATNLHVIGGESTIRVRLFKDQTEYPAATIAGIDQDHDLVLIRIAAKKPLPALRLGDSSAVSAGDRVYAIGNPLGFFDYSITDGLISQVRQSKALTFLQISAPISQGSSGGPLFNTFGEVIGVTTAIVAAGQAINIAVPTNYLRPMMKQPIALSTQEFARVTQEVRGPGSDDDNTPIKREIPDHDLAIWDGCSETQKEDVIRSIGEAIEIGAPLYNQGTAAGYEACFRVYEGTSLKFSAEAGCRGVRDAFGAGIARAKGMTSYKQKAWALRDTFDGLIHAFGRWCKQDAPCRKKFGAP